MTPTKYSTLTNQQVISRLSEMLAKREDGGVYLLVRPKESWDIIQEAINRIEALGNIKNLFERPAYAQMSLEISPDYKLELNLKVKNGGGAQ